MSHLFNLKEQVICDVCYEDYSDKSDSGGVLFYGWKACPNCMPGVINKAIEDKEQEFLYEVCPRGVSFRQWAQSIKIN